MAGKDMNNGNMKIWNGGNTGRKTKITAPPEGDAAVKENIRR